MDESALGHTLGTLSAEVAAVDQRLSDHIEEERKRDDQLLLAVKEIQSTLSQAKGAQKLLVWLLATLFAAVALAKGWVWPTK